MGNRHWGQLLIGVLCIGLLSSAFASAQSFGTAYERGYREGVSRVSRTDDRAASRRPSATPSTATQTAAIRIDTAAATRIEMTSGAASFRATAAATTESA